MKVYDHIYDAKEDIYLAQIYGHMTVLEKGKEIAFDSIVGFITHLDTRTFWWKNIDCFRLRLSVKKAVKSFDGGWHLIVREDI